MAEKIVLKGGKLSVSNHPIIPYIEGDGVGLDIWRNAQTYQLEKNLLIRQEPGYQMRP